MDIETLRLEREEKRRQRRERIRRILEDDPTKTTKDETFSTRTTRSTAATRRSMENTATSHTAERTRNVILFFMLLDFCAFLSLLIVYEGMVCRLEAKEHHVNISKPL